MTRRTWCGNPRTACTSSRCSVSPIPPHVPGWVCRPAECFCIRAPRVKLVGWHCILFSEGPLEGECTPGGSSPASPRLAIGRFSSCRPMASILTHTSPALPPKNRNGDGRGRRTHVLVLRAPTGSDVVTRNRRSTKVGLSCLYTGPQVCWSGEMRVDSVKF